MNWQLIIWVAIVAANFVLDNDNGIVCSMVKKTRNEASIDLDFAHMSFTKQPQSDAKFPIFMLYYPDLAHIQKIPNRNKYREIYKDREQLKYFLTKDDRFDVVIDKGFEQNVYNKYFSPPKHPDLKFILQKSGLYCVYVAPSNLVENFKFEVTFNNSYGLLTFHRYMNIYFEFILLGFTFGLYQYIYSIIFKRDGKFENRASLVTLFVMFFILIPLIFINFISLIIDLLANNYKFGDLSHQILLEVRYFLDTIFDVGFKAMILILAMGEGSIYCPKNPLPTNLKNFTILLFLSNLVIDFISFSINPAHAHNALFRSYDTYSKSDQSFFGMILEYCLLAFPYIWFLSTLYFYFKTLTKFTGESRLEIRNNQIYQAFKKSISFFVFAPFISDFIDMFIYWYKTFSLYQYQFIPIGDEDGDGLSIVRALMAEAVDLSFDWSNLVQTITFIITLMLIYHIWIKKNIGLDDSTYNKIANAISREEDFTQDSITLADIQT